MKQSYHRTVRRPAATAARAPHRSSTRLGRALFWLSALLLGLTHAAQASHYRYGSLTWRTVSSDASRRTVELKVSNSFRRSFFGTPTVGSVVNNVGTLQFGDNTSAAVNLTVTSVDVTADVFYGEYTVTHVYPATGLPRNYKAYFTSSARISTLTNNANGSWYVGSDVNVGTSNSSPVSALPPVVNLATGQAAAAFMLPANDPDGDALTYSLATSADMGGISFVNAPGLAINATTGRVTFNTTGLPVGGLYSAVIKVSDGRTSVLVDFIIQITRVSAPPQFDYSQTPSNGYVYQVAPGTPVSFRVRATDSDAGDVVTLQGIGLPPGASMSPALPTSGNPVASQFSWTPTLSTLGTRVITFVAQDAVGVQTTTAVTIQVSTKPVFDVPPTPAAGSSLQVTPGTPISQLVQVSSADPASPVRILSATGLPAGASYGPALPTAAANPTSTTLNWTPVVADWGPHTVTFTAANSYNDQQTHALEYIVNSAPSFVSTPGALNVVAGQPFRYDIVTTDPDLPYGDELEIEHPILPAWLTLTDNGDGTATLTGTPAVTDAGNNPVTLVAADLYHHGTSYGLVTQSFDINVIPCTLQALAQNVTVALDANGQAQVTAAQVDNGSTASCGIASLTVSPSLFGCAQRGANAVTLTLTDTYGNTSTAPAVVTVVDDQLPSITAPAAVAVGTDAGQCTASGVALGTPATADNCTGVTVSNDAPASFPQGTTTVTWTATDASGNTATATQQVTVSDQELPTLIVPANLTVAAPATLCGAVVNFTATAADNCAGATVQASVASGNVFPVGTTTVQLTATDASGNIRTGSFTVTVQDVTAPAVITRNVSVTLVGGTAQVTAAQVNNGSTDACGIASLRLSRQQFSCADLGDNPVTLTVTDVHGNVASAPAVVTVVGSLPAPTIAVTPATGVYTGGVPTTLYLGYGAQSTTLTASGGVSYAWAPAAGLSSTSVANPVFTATVPGAYTYTVTVTNQYGCVATATVTLRVVDARCGNKNDKVLVCHNGHEICIAPSAVPAHLTGHPDDQLGSCGTTQARGVAATPAAPAAAAVSAELVFEAYPNPTGGLTTLHLRPATSAAAQVRVYDSMGRVVATLFEGPAEAGRDYQLTLNAASLANGLYLCRYESNGQVLTQRLTVAK